MGLSREHIRRTPRKLCGGIDAVEVKHECIKKHLLVTAIGKSVIRLIPPLIATKEDCDKAVGILREILK